MFGNEVRSAGDCSAAVAAGRRHRAKSRCMALSSPCLRRQSECGARLSAVQLVWDNRGRAAGAYLGAASTQSRRLDGPSVVGAGPALETMTPASAAPGVAT